MDSDRLPSLALSSDLLSLFDGAPSVSCPSGLPLPDLASRQHYAASLAAPSESFEFKNFGIGAVNGGEPGLSAASNGTAHGLAHLSMGAGHAPEAFAASMQGGAPAHRSPRHYADGYQAPASPLQTSALPPHSPHAAGGPAAYSAPSSPLRAGAAKFGSMPASFDRSALPDRAALLASMAARGCLLDGMQQAQAPVPRAASPGGYPRASAFSGSFSAGYPPDYAPDDTGGVPLSVPLRSAPLPGVAEAGGPGDGGGGLTNPVGEDDDGDDFGSEDLGHSSDLGGPDGKRRKMLLCEQDPDAPGLTVEQRRKIRRRINNRASAQRVRAKREQDLTIASAQVAQLDAEKEALMQRAAASQQTCAQMVVQLKAARERWHKTCLTNVALCKELMQLRAQLEAFQKANGGAPQPAAPAPADSIDAPVKAEGANPAGPDPAAAPAAAGDTPAADAPAPSNPAGLAGGGLMPPPQRPPLSAAQAGLRRPSLDNLISAASFDLANIFAA
ncbi:hypothetical protein WJX81_002121 [Elliptochloris bilobata]|uniref:BZIP domain-containing protein n=1 Tax=Elliptochloris bilobata TaxID=381761 RepID=A0AAW1RSI5_9CHLO